ncbi:FAD-dependent oxidoreductase [Humibacter ginsenosidimutans]|uniref:FAD-dependent oxidoreductase n=1 Tax=Humibacter ginsenosidimutans TaxID=2599293 RepID=A0A5B8LYK3_9MICO|nr:FAD-dependent oxidoreductase [Humibacter ginsenosidimutans]QDZ13598.1 FAD-dependent oxidoreductase [Humibacter ginsenosidimutans]
MAALNIAVVGGGIAGLTAATALSRQGHRVEVLERQSEWPAVGWGLTLTGPALRALRSIGLDQACIAVGYPIDSINNCDVRGVTFHTVEPPSLLGPGEPVMVGIGRPALSRVLREAAQNAGATLTLGAKVVSIDDEGDSATLVLDDGTRKTVDLVVAGDGVHSAARTAIGIDEEPRFLGQAVWRTTVQRPSSIDRLTTFNGQEHSSGIIPISEHDAYVFTTQIVDDRSADADVDLAADLRELLSPLEGEMAALRDGIVDSERVVRRPVMAIIVEEPWYRGRTVLIGDAAHTCAPGMVSGAALAIEDAVTLADELGARESVAGALDAFFRRRLDRARLVVEASEEMTKAEFEHRYAEEHEIQDRAFAALAAPA